jgi:hypothetical protein
MKMKSLLSLIFILFLFSAKAQFNYSTGASLIYGKGKLPKNADAGDEPTILGYGIFFYPRYNISETDAGAVSIGIPLTIGVSGSANSRTGTSISLTADLPLTLDYNIGAGATEESTAGFGGFIGAGFGYTYTNQAYDYYVNGILYDTEQLKGRSFGPLAHAGIKALISDKVYMLRVFYKLGLEKEKFKTFGVAVGVSF